MSLSPFSSHTCFLVFSPSLFIFFDALFRLLAARNPTNRGERQLIEAKLQALGLVLPAAPKAPPGIKLSFAWTRIRGNLYGPETGQHARMAVGMATLPVNNAVTIAAEVEFAL
jgi:hypothetical protein